MELKIIERIMLLDILPQQGDILTIKLIRDLKNKISFNEAELKKYKLVFDKATVNWDHNVPEEKVEFDFTETELEIIKKSLRKLNEMQKVSELHLPLFKKFDAEG